MNPTSYGVATVSSIDKIVGLFCRISSLLKGSFAKETCHFIGPTNQSHPIADHIGFIAPSVTNTGYIPT